MLSVLTKKSMNSNMESNSNSMKFAPLPMSELLSNLKLMRKTLNSQDSDSSYSSVDDSDNSIAETVAKKPSPIKRPEENKSIDSVRKLPKSESSLTDKCNDKENRIAPSNNSTNTNVIELISCSSEKNKRNVLKARNEYIKTTEGKSKRTPEGAKLTQKPKSVTPAKFKSGIRRFTPGSGRSSCASQKKSIKVSTDIHRDSAKCLFPESHPKTNIESLKAVPETPVNKPILAPVLATPSYPQGVVGLFPESHPRINIESLKAVPETPANKPISAPVLATPSYPQGVVGLCPESHPRTNSESLKAVPETPANRPVPAPVFATPSYPQGVVGFYPESYPRRDIESIKEVPETPVNKPIPVSATPSYPQGVVDHNSKILFKRINIKGKNYMFIKKLGVGGSSDVFKVLEIGTSCEYAVKCVDLATDPELAQGYINEVRLLRELRNTDRVIRLYDYEYDRTNQLLRLVLEVGETDLSSILKAHGDAGLPSTLVLHYWEEMLNAVSHIHEHGVIHADLKPANFLLVCGRLKLIDFGIASAISSDATSVVRSQATGTFSYISPEALMGGAGGYSTAGHDGNTPIKISFRSDVWSLGCILYSFVYRKTPFGHIPNLAKIAAILDPHHRIEYPPANHLPSSLIAALKWCLTYNAKSRPHVKELLAMSHLHLANTSLPKSVLETLQPLVKQKVLEYDERLFK